MKREPPPFSLAHSLFPQSAFVDEDLILCGDSVGILRVLDSNKNFECIREIDITPIILKDVTPTDSERRRPKEKKVGSLEKKSSFESPPHFGSPAPPSLPIPSSPSLNSLIIPPRGGEKGVLASPRGYVSSVLRL